jgi:hypothetical protein
MKERMVFLASSLSNHRSMREMKMNPRAQWIWSRGSRLL